MDVLEPFWAGALRYGCGENMERLASFGIPLDQVDVEVLVAAGVERRRAARWLRCGPLETRGIAVRWTDPAYPEALRALKGPPVLLVEGDVRCLASARSVGVVGTRRCTAYGRSVARTLGRALAAQGVVVVSGLARGIDACAHQGAMEVGRTVAVLGHGLAFTSPRSHWRLREELVERGGLVVSVWPDAQEPAVWTFPRRNRWIAALSQHVVVVEAPLRSGALITAEQAIQLERTVWAVPGQIGQPAGEGCLQLIHEGSAKMVCSTNALLREVTGRAPPRDEDWLERLCAGASLDEIAQLRGLSTMEVVREVTRLELAGRLVRLPGQRYARAGPEGPVRQGEGDRG